MRHFERARARSYLRANGPFARIDLSRSKLEPDAQELVVLGDAIAARQAAGLDLPGVGGDREIGDERVFGLARAVRDDRAVAGVGRVANGVERLGDACRSG